MNELDFARLAIQHGMPEAESNEFARWLDEQDPLCFIREEFRQPNPQVILHTAHIQLNAIDASEALPPITYLCGNSLGLQPKALADDLNTGLNQWADLGVFAYAHGSMPASSCDQPVAEQVAREIVGAEPNEVALTNNLSINMHLLLATFYRPEAEKNCILIEQNAFPTDYYAVESHIAWHGFDPKKCIIQAQPRNGEWCLRTEDIVSLIRQNASRLAFIWLPGVHYITGQLFDMAKITEAGHQYAQCPVGWDLAHAVGNVPLELHSWDVDVAVWCSYKYLNASPGGVGGLFVHQKHHHISGIHGPSPADVPPSVGGPKLTGWWSHRPETRFDMTNQMELATGAAAYRISNPPFFAMIALKTSLKIFRQCGGMGPVRDKSIRLTGYLEYLLTSSRYALPGDCVELVTPSDPNARGAQLTLSFKRNLEHYHRELSRHGFICDMRRPSCIRVTPNPLYTRFVDVLSFAACLHRLLTES